MATVKMSFSIVLRGILLACILRGRLWAEPFCKRLNTDFVLIFRPNRCFLDIYDLFSNPDGGSDVILQIFQQNNKPLIIFQKNFADAKYQGKKLGHSK